MKHRIAVKRGEGILLAAALSVVFTACILAMLLRIPAEVSVAPVHDVRVELPKLNLNAATAEELCDLPGIGETLAARILEYRTGHGGFARIEELTEVEGIGEVKFEAIRDLVIAE